MLTAREARAMDAEGGLAAGTTLVTDKENSLAARAMDLENSLAASLNRPDHDSLSPFPLVSAPAPAAGADAQNTDYRFGSMGGFLLSLKKRLGKQEGVW